MRDLDDRLAGDGIPVEGEQTPPAELIQDAVDASRVVGDCEEFRPRDTPGGRLAGLDRGDKAQEGLARDLTARGREGIERRVRLPRERAEYAPHGRVAVAGQPASSARLEQLGQGVLEQGELTGLAGDVGQHLGREPRLERYAHALGRPDDGPLQLVP